MVDVFEFVCSGVERYRGGHGRLRVDGFREGLLKELVAGKNLQEAASKLNITRLTSRNRLSRIMDKTGTRRQADLLQLILRSRVPVQ